MTMRKPAILLLIALALAACKTTQQPDANASFVPASAPLEAHASEAEATEAAALQVIGIWKVTELSELSIPDPEMAAMAEDIRAKIIADLRMDIRVDSTYEITGFDGLNVGKWKLEQDRKLSLMNDNGEVDVITLSRMTDSGIVGDMRTEMGITGLFTLARER